MNWISILASAVAILLLVLLNVLLTGRRQRNLQSLEEARSRLCLDNPGLQIADDGILSDDGTCALFHSPGSRDLGLVIVCEDGLVTRVYKEGQYTIADIKNTETSGLVISGGDFGLRPVRVRLQNPETRRRWRRRLSVEAALPEGS